MARSRRPELGAPDNRRRIVLNRADLAARTV